MFKKHILKNGLRIILVPMKNSMATTFLVLVEAGSKYENKEINGISHFLEHMCFKGTKKRPNALAISSEMESLGAVYNAFTGQEVTGYYAKVSKDKIDNALDIVSDMYMNPLLKEEDIQKEKGVIIEEINMYEDLPMRKVHENFMRLVYGDQPAGWAIAGKKEIVSAVNREKMAEYRKKHYVPEATTIVVAGSFSEKVMLKKLDKIFGSLSKSNKTGKEKVVESQSKPKVALETKQSDQTHLVMGFRAFGMFDERKYILSVLCDILGGGMSSRLFQKVREELGAAYYVNCGSSLFTDHGLLAISAGVDNKKIKIVIRAILGELNKIKNTSVSKAELDKSKNHICGSMMIGLETSDSLAEFYGEQELFKEKMLDPEQIIKKIKAVKAGDVKALAKEILQNSKLNLAIIGPFQNASEFEKELKL
ncbi:MAG: pitrilysin family protein [bacterium]|nr:pitrilysin family protein [bacterium]